MRFAPRFVCCWLSLASFMSLAVSAVAAPQSDTLLSRSTKGYVSVARPAEFDERWQRTQFGQLYNDELMQPFVEQLRKQFADKYDDIENKLGITYDDLGGVPSGELSLAILEKSEGRDAPIVITINVTDHPTEAAGLVKAAEERFTARGGRKTTSKQGDTTFTIFEVPPAEAGKPTQKTVYFIKDNILVGIDDSDEAAAILKRFAGDAKDSLHSVTAYTETMERCKKEAGSLEPEVRWFAEPFGLIESVRSLQESSPRSKKKDVVKILQEQGFDAIRGAGGYVNLLVDEHVDILHRSAVFAPAVAGKESDPLRWNLGMRIMQLPNAPEMVPQSWVPRMSASYTSLNLDLVDVFENVGTLVDALQNHKGAFANTLEGLETDVYGTQVNIRKEFIDNMGERITLVTDYVAPITVGSERSIFAIEAKDEKKLAAALAKYMTKEPDVERRDFNDMVIWERMPPDANVPNLHVEVPGFTPLSSAGPEEKKAQADEPERERVLPNSAVCVALGHIMMASDIKYLEEILAGYGQREMLSGSIEYQQVAEQLKKVSPGPYSVWSYGLTDEEFRPTFELVRQNKMPESKTMLGKLLNNMLTTDAERDEKVLRKQRVDGTTLPSFEAVRRYFGPAGRALRSDQDGWFLSGVVLNKQAP